CSCAISAAAPSELSTLPLHDALPILPAPVSVPAMKKASSVRATGPSPADGRDGDPGFAGPRHGRFRPPGVAEHDFVGGGQAAVRSEEHTSELQSRENLVCRLLLEKKK